MILMQKLKKKKKKKKNIERHNLIEDLKLNKIIIGKKIRMIALL